MLLNGMYAVLLLCWVSISKAAVVPDPSWETIDLWPGGVIPYNLPDDMYTPSKKGLILSAMRRWESKTCVKFVPWTDELRQEYGEVRYINFFSAGSCFSKKGKHKNQPQLIGIGKGCLKMWTVLHELGHAVGRIHEMERLDRDFYIDIHYENMNPGSVQNYETIDKKEIVFETYGVPYDYKSIMHYGPKAWSANKEPVMGTKDPAYQTVIGQGEDISFFDALYANRAYNCSAKCSPSLSGLCRNGGFLGGPDCRCICQDGYTGQFCDQTLPGFEHIVQWKCQSGWDFHAGKCYLYVKDRARSYNNARLYCMRRSATLVTFKSRPTMEWLSHMTKEKKSIHLKTSYWIGITREANTSELKWVDNTFVDQNLIALVDDTARNERACAKFDGETVLLDSCGTDAQNGAICVKDFDPDCGGRYTVRDTPITVQTPNFPRGYPENIECTYVFQTPGTMSTLNISFDTFSLEANCNNDYTEVMLTNDVTQPGIRYCDKDLNQTTLTSDGNVAVLRFKTNARVTSSGFRVTVSQIASQVKTTPVPLTFLETLQSYFQKSKENIEQRKEQSFRKLKAIYDLIMSMAFSNVM